MKKFISLIASLALCFASFSCFASAADVSMRDQEPSVQTVSLSEFVANCGVDVDTNASILIKDVASISTQSDELPVTNDTDGEYVEITGVTSGGDGYKTIIMPYTVTESGLEPVMLTNGITRGSTGGVSVNFKSVNITVVVTAYYNGSSSALKPLGVSGYWTLYSSSGTSNTVSRMTLDYYVYGATYNSSSPNVFTNNVTYHATVNKASPSKGITYSKYNALDDGVYFTTHGDIMYGQGVSVTVTVNGKSYYDSFAV